MADIEMEGADLTAWMGKPPTKRKSGTAQYNATSPSSSQTDEDVDMVNGGTPARSARSDSSIMPTIETRGASDNEDTDSASHAHPSPYNGLEVGFYIDVPALPDDADTYQHPPGYYTAARVISEYRKDRFVLQRASGEKDLVCTASS